MSTSAPRPATLWRYHTLLTEQLAEIHRARAHLGVQAAFGLAPGGDELPDVADVTAELARVQRLLISTTKPTADGIPITPERRAILFQAAGLPVESV